MTTFLLAGVLAVLGLPWLSTAGIARPRYLELVVGVCNDDWASKGSNLADMITAGCQVIFIQEGKRAHYRQLHDQAGKRLLPYGTWGVVQDTSSPARSGSVVIYQHSVFSGRGRGWTFGVKAPGIMARWIAWVRGLLGGLVRAFLFSGHWPPHRVSKWQLPFTKILIARLWLAHKAGRLILGGVDSNQHGGPPLPAWLRWHSAVAGSIDGLICSARVTVVEARELPKDTSDHHPQVFKLRIPVWRFRRLKARAA